MSWYIWVGIAWACLMANRKARRRVVRVVQAAVAVVHPVTPPPDPVPVVLWKPRIAGQRQTSVERVRSVIETLDLDAPVRRMLLAYGWDSAVAA